MTTTAEIDMAAMYASLGAFAAWKEEVPDEKLVAAGEFVAHFGALGDLIEDPELGHIQNTRAYGQLAHWSVERTDQLNRRPDGYELHMEYCGTCSYLETILGIRETLLGEACGECGRGPDGHDFRPTVDYEQGGVEVLRWFEPHGWCKEPWQRVDTIVVAPGTIASWQVSDAYSARWAAPLADGTFALISRTYYVAHDHHGGVTLQRDDDYGIVHDPVKPEFAEFWSTGNTQRLDSTDPLSEDLAVLADESPDPEPGEWITHAPGSPTFAWPGK